jgi:hypothetical protein
MSDEGQLWDHSGEYGAPAPPVAPDQLREWEDRHGVRLPATLSKMLMIQNDCPGANVSSTMRCLRASG